MDEEISKEVSRLRRDYRQDTLGLSDMAEDPYIQFQRWFEAAGKAKVPEPNAMTLATCSRDGHPSARIVLLKGFDNNGFTFFTNYNSRKGKELAENPRAALVFNWLELERQIRIEGSVQKLSEEESTAYFESRPKGSQIGAWASPQSQIVPNRKMLEKSANELMEKYKNADRLPKPPQWGGFRVIPQRIEFWQGRSNRLHDRMLYEYVNNGWTINRLAP